jgi:hypothetical protein
MFLTLARWIVQRYPHNWRSRYGNEMCALLDESGVTRLEIVDLLRGCLSEWKAAAADPELHPVAFQFVTGVSFLARVLALYASFTLPAAVGAWLLRQYLGTPPSWIGIVGSVIGPVAALRLIVHLLAALRGRARVKRSTVLRHWIPLLSFGLLLMFWSEGLRWGTLLHLWFVPFYLQLGPRLQADDPVWALGSRRHLLYWANLELARCESLDPRDPTRAPQLASAQAEVDRLNRELQLIYAAIRERRPLPEELTQRT